MLRRSIQQHKKFSVTAAKAAGKKLKLIFRKFLKCLKILVGRSLCKFFFHTVPSPENITHLNSMHNIFLNLFNLRTSIFMKIFETLLMKIGVPIVS